jgi:hypothetical protein
VEEQNWNSVLNKGVYKMSYTLYAAGRSVYILDTSYE